MVRPCRVRQPDGGIGGRHADQLQRLPDRACAAGGRHTGHAVGSNTVAQHQIADRCAKGGITGQPSIGLGGLIRQNPALGLFDRPHDGGIAGRVLVDADAKVDLVGARIGAIFGHQHQDLVGGLRVQIVQHQAAPVASGRSAYMPHSDQEPS